MVDRQDRLGTDVRKPQQKKALSRVSLTSLHGDCRRVGLIVRDVGANQRTDVAYVIYTQNPISDRDHTTNTIYVHSKHSNEMK
jgi:hypothetical protein